MEFADQSWRLPQVSVEGYDRKVFVDRWMNSVPTSSSVSSDDYLLYPSSQPAWPVNPTPSVQTTPAHHRWSGDELQTRFMGHGSYSSSIDGGDRTLSRSLTLPGVPFDRLDPKNNLYTSSNPLSQSLSPEQSSVSPVPAYRSSLDGGVTSALPPPGATSSPRELARLAELNGIKVHNSEHRCWQHGCNGRSFTTRSNLTRHQRERSSARSVYTCPRCDYKFSRKLARDQHVQHQRCTKLPRWPSGRRDLVSAASMIPRSAVGYELHAGAPPPPPPPGYMGINLVN